MKRLLLAAVGLAAVAATSALAADMPPRGRLPPPRAPAYVPFFTWNGFYVGINAGYGFGHSKWTDTVTQASTGNFNVSGALVGGTIGYNVQFGAFVFGLEGDIDWSNIKGSTTHLRRHLRDHQQLARHRTRAHRLCLRPLPALFHRRRGLRRRQRHGRSASASFSETKVGWTGGGGLEYAFIDNWSAKLEYLYVDLGKATCNAACSGGDPFDVTFKTNIVRGGVNYKF